MNNFISVIKELEKKREETTQNYNTECTRLKTEYMTQIMDINKAIKIITDMNDVCLMCEGKGHIKEYDDAHDDRGHNVPCKHCNGTGYRIQLKD